MSQQQPPTGGPENPQQWPQRFDPDTGQPLPAAGADLPPTPPVGADATQFLGYQPSALPSDGPPPTEPRLHESPWSGNGPVPPGAPGPQPWQQPPFGPGTDALGRTVQPGGYVAKPSTGKVLGLVGLVMVLVGAVAAGTFLFLTRDDDQGTQVAGGATSATGPTAPSTGQGSSGSSDPTGSPSTSPSTSEPTAPSTSSSPTLTAPVVPSVTSNPTPKGPPIKLKTYGAQVDMAEFAGDWNFRWGEVALDAKGVSASNYPNCSGVAQGSTLNDLGCKYAGLTVQRNAQDKVTLVTIILQFDSAKKATTASKKLKDTSFNLADHLPAKDKQGMWKTGTSDNLVVFTAATATQKIDERLLNRYVGYRNADTTGALAFM